MRTIVVASVLLIAAANCVTAQSRPFPQNVDYPFGYKATSISPDDVLNAYSTWKFMFLRSCNGTYRVGTEDINRTISESMGYGLLLTVYFGEKIYFDGLLDFYRSKRTSFAHGLMGWETTCDSMRSEGAATDGDLDVAFALVAAFVQWGGNYLNEARSIMSVYKEHYFTKCAGAYTMLPGTNWGGCNFTNLSYYTPAYFRVFADVTRDAFWDSVANDTYVLLKRSADPETGIVPDGQASDGTPVAAGGWTDYFYYDACRVPWRISLDYTWNGDTSAGKWCTRITDWAYGIGPAGIVDGYRTDGTPLGHYNTVPFIGGFAVAAMCNSQAVVDNFADRLVYLCSLASENYYFGINLRCLYMLALTGNFWKPVVVNATTVTVSGDGGMTSISVDKGTLRMHAAVLPENATGKNVIWKVINGTGEATIDQEGLLTAVSNGEVTVEATAGDIDGASDRIVVSITNQSTVGISENSAAVLNQPCLFSNYPNPFNPGTTIRFRVGKPGRMSLTIYNSIGCRIRTLSDDFRNPGEYSVYWDATDEGGKPVASGIYFCVMRTEDRVAQRKMMVIR